MSDKINIVLSPEYAKHLELLKQVIPSKTGEEITDDSKMIEVLIDSFIEFIQEQASSHAHSHEHNHEGGCCGGGDEHHFHEHDNKKEEGGCCKH